MKKSVVVLVAAIIIALSSCKKEDNIVPSVPPVSDTITSTADTAVLIECTEAAYKVNVSSVDSNASVLFRIHVKIMNLTDSDIYINGREGMRIETQPDSIRRLPSVTSMEIISPNVVNMGDQIYRVSAHTVVSVVYSGVETVVIPNSFFYRGNLKSVNYSFDENGPFSLSGMFRNSSSTDWVNP